MDLHPIVTTFIQLASSVRHHGQMMNERYFHHLFSSNLRAQGIPVDITGETALLQLHPEWPTCKESTGLDYGRYRNINDKYYPVVDGGAGFLDFTVGNYLCPDIGIEFTAKHSWCGEEVVYDFIKLMDARNPFKVGLSYNAIMRRKEISKGADLKKLTDRIDQALASAHLRLGNCRSTERRLLFIISELGVSSSRHWYFDNNSSCFKLGLPVA